MYNIYNQLVSEQIYVERYSLMKVGLKIVRHFISLVKSTLLFYNTIQNTTFHKFIHSLAISMLMRSKNLFFCLVNCFILFSYAKFVIIIFYM